MKPHRSALLFSATLALTGAAFAENAPPASLRATIASVSADGATLAVRSRAGEARNVNVGDKTRVILVIPASLADVKQGAFVGVAAVPGDGETLKALEVHIFPEAMRGTGEGFRPFDLAPKSSMTNGAVSARVQGVEGPKLTVNYKGGREDDRGRPRHADRRLRSGGAKRSQARRRDHRARAQGREWLRRRRLPAGRQGWPRPADVTANQPLCLRNDSPRRAPKIYIRNRKMRLKSAALSQ